MTKLEALAKLYEMYPKLKECYDTNKQVRAALLAYETNPDITMADCFSQLVIRLCGLGYGKD